MPYITIFKSQIYKKFRISFNLFQNPLLESEVSVLAEGLEGATILSVFSSSLPETFIVPRTVPATAILFKEPDPLSTARNSLYKKKPKRACAQTILPLGRMKKKLSPVMNTISKVTQPISSLKSRFYNKLGLSCLVPKLLRPFHKLIEKITCKLGLDIENEYMRGSLCNPLNCNETSLETKMVTNDLGLPNTDYLMKNRVTTYDDCFRDIPKATYGSRVLAKIVDDVSCNDYRYMRICEELINQDQILMEENCRSPG